MMIAFGYLRLQKRNFKYGVMYCKVNYRTKQEAQLPQRNSASAAHMEGAKPLVYSPSPLWLHLCVRSNPKPATNVRQACRRKAHFKMNRAFKGIQGHRYWCRQESRTVYCRNVQLMPTLFLKLTKITATGKRQIRRFQRPHAGLKTDRQTDGQTDGFTIANTALCIASYADAL